MGKCVLCHVCVVSVCVSGCVCLAAFQWHKRRIFIAKQLRMQLCGVCTTNKCPRWCRVVIEEGAMHKTVVDLQELHLQRL